MSATTLKRPLLVATTVDLGPPWVVHCLHQPYHVYIGRGSKWGNPYRIGREATRLQAIHQYERYLSQCPWLMTDLPQLQGLVLGGFCAPHPCHGDVLLRLANDSSGRQCSPQPTQHVSGSVTDPITRHDRAAAPLTFPGIPCRYPSPGAGRSPR
jgi:hypothetical protein